MKIDAILLIGPTGAGKSPLGDHIERHGLSGRRCHHFDFGHQLRTIAAQESPPEEFTASEHLFIREVLEKALLLEQEHFRIAEKVLNSFLRRRQYSPGDVVILNGLPRHAGQAADMDRLVSVSRVVILECSPDVVHKRIKGNTGGDRTGRDDDALSLIRKKLDIFAERTAPLIGHYGERGCEIVSIEVTEEAGASGVYGALLCSMQQPRVRNQETS